MARTPIARSIHSQPGTAAVFAALHSSGFGRTDPAPEPVRVSSVLRCALPMERPATFATREVQRLGAARDHSSAAELSREPWQHPARRFERPAVKHQWLAISG